MIYLDSAATSLLKPPSVARAASMAIRTMASPGRGGHSAAMRAADTVFACRAAAAALFHVPEPERVVFTMNATHALDIAIHSLVSPGDPVVISGYEHNSVTRPLYALGAQVRVAASPLFDPAAAVDAFRRALPGARAAVCTMVSNVFGYVLPVEEIAALCRERKVPLILDCSQSAGILPVSLRKLPAAFLCMPGHKSLYGPQGTGVLVCGHALRPLLAGGTGSLSERAQMPEFTPDVGEAGTHNVPGICALHEGVRFVRSVGLSQIAAHEKMLAQLLIAELEAMPGVRVFHGAAQTGVVSFLLEREDVEKTAARLSRQGFALRAGLHCAPLAHESAGTLQSGTVRAGFSVFNTAREVRELVRVLSC